MYVMPYNIIHKKIYYRGNKYIKVYTLHNFFSQFDDEDAEEDTPLEKRKKIFSKECKTIAYLTIKSNTDCKTLQNDLAKFSIWEQKWKMTFHPDKCNVLSITRNKITVKHTYTLHGRHLEHADKAKYLGVTIQSDLKWNSHINNSKTKANKTLGFLRRNINISSTKVKEQAYKSFSSTITRICLFCMEPIFILKKT
jgi:hypothetical protein